LDSKDRHAVVAESRTDHAPGGKRPSVVMHEISHALGADHYPRTTNSDPSNDNNCKSRFRCGRIEFRGCKYWRYERYSDAMNYCLMQLRTMNYKPVSKDRINGLVANTWL
jgi:hypothetical protein